MIFRIFISLIFTLSLKAVSAQYEPEQIRAIDSLKLIVESDAPDSSKLSALIEWDNIIYEHDTELDVKINRQIIDICEKGMMRTPLTIREREIYLSARGMACNNIGLVFIDYGNYKEALENFQISLQIAEYFKDSVKQGNALNNIGIIYDHLKLPEKALEYYNKSFSFDNDDPYSVGTYYNNVGLCYYQLGDTTKALESYKHSLTYSDSIGDYRGKGNTLSNIALVLLNQDKLDEAIQYYSQAIEEYLKVNADDGIALAYKGLGLCYYYKKDYAKTQTNCQKGYELGLQSKSLMALKESCDCLYVLYKAQNKTDLALQYHELYVLYRDSVESVSKNEEVLRLDFQFNLDRQRLQDSLQFANQQQVQELVYETDLHKKQKVQYVLFAGIGVCAIAGVLVFVGYVRKKRDHEIIAKQKLEVETQKHIVEEKNKEITDSINYAKRIQEAILPSDQLLKENLPESFIVYKPKDIVAGDFYWLEKVNDLIIFAVADCTGHGVPGAMVSVVCHNALNRAVNEFKLTDPGKILDKTRELVVETFENNSSQNNTSSTIRDGMDISLCVWNKATNELLFSGANNSLFLIRDKQLSETLPDKQPIGKYAEEKPFTSNKLNLLKGDILYLYTDGYADQFGGSNGKKFKYKQLKELLIKNANLPLAQQANILDQTFEGWKGNLEQVDDVCMMGVLI